MSTDIFLAPTGSGKTLAFLIPLVQSVLNRTIPYIRGMVVAPTRVLAEQIYKVLLELIRGTPLKARILTGSRQTNFQPTTRIGNRHLVQKFRNSWTANHKAVRYTFLDIEPFEGNIHHLICWYVLLAV